MLEIINYNTAPVLQVRNATYPFAVVNVATVTALRTTEPSYAGQVIMLLGHTIAGIGGGNFRYDATDTTTADNNGTVIVTVGSKRWKRAFETYEVEYFGAIGDGIANDTVAINACIVTASNDPKKRTAKVYCRNKYKATQIVIHKKTIVDMNYTGNLIQDPTFNGKFIVSYGVDTYWNSGKFYNINSGNPLADANVPYRFGIVNGEITPNYSATGNHEGVKLYGTWIYAENLMVDKATGDTFIMQGPRAASLSSFDTQEEGYLHNVIFRQGKKSAFIYEGPHNISIGDVRVILSNDSTEYGVICRNGENFAAVNDVWEQLHIYAASGNNNRENGLLLSSGMKIEHIMLDSVGAKITDPGENEAQATIRSLLMTNVGSTPQNGTSWTGLQVDPDASSVYVGEVKLSVNANAQGTFNAINWEGNNGYIGRIIEAYDNSNANVTCLNVTGNNFKLDNFKIVNFNSAGVDAIKLNASFALIGDSQSYISNCDNGLNFVGGQKNAVKFICFTNGTQTAVKGITPTAFNAQLFDITDIGAGATSLKSCIITDKESSNVSVTSVATQTFTIAHGLLYTPNIDNIHLTVRKVTAINDYRIDNLTIDSVDATNIYGSVRIGVASATSGAVIKITAQGRI